MLLIGIHYSDPSEELVHSKEDDFTLERYNKLVSEFDELRQKYNQEHCELRARYQDKFDSILEALKALECKKFPK